MGKNNYIHFKWQVARIWSVHRCKVQLSIALSFVIGTALWGFVIGAPYQGAAFAWVAPAMTLGSVLIFGSFGAFVVSAWGVFHFGQHAMSIQCRVHGGGRLSIHWSPGPTWSCSGRSRPPRIPYRALFEETSTWIAVARDYGFCEIELNSPLCLKQPKNGPIILRPEWTQIMNAMAVRVDAVGLQFVAVAPMGAFNSWFYGFWWPGVQRPEFPGKPGHLATGGYTLLVN